MSIIARLVKLEQRLRYGVDFRLLSDEQLIDRLRVLTGKLTGVDLSHSSEAEINEASDEFLRQFIVSETGQDCNNWPTSGLLSECRKLIRATV